MGTIFTNLLGTVIAVIGIVIMWIFPNGGIYMKIFAIVIYGAYAIRGILCAIYLHLLHSHKGREFLKKIPIKRIQKRASEY